jgi:hypothetical protein
MKALILALAAPFLASCAGLEVSVPVPVRAIAHPVRAWKSLSGKTPVDKKLMAIADSVLMDANVADYVTTRRGAFPGTHGCELNPLLTTAPCQIDVPRFTGIKLVVGAFGVAQWLPVPAGWVGPGYIRSLILIDAALAVPLAIADANNFVQLTK